MMWIGTDIRGDDDDRPRINTDAMDYRGFIAIMADSSTIGKRGKNSVTNNNSNTSCSWYALNRSMEED